ncbi:hypothetical protein QFZ97_002971 [Paraburkholderia youngii]
MCSIRGFATGAGRRRPTRCRSGRSRRGSTVTCRRRRRPKGRCIHRHPAVRRFRLARRCPRTMPNRFRPSGRPAPRSPVSGRSRSRRPQPATGSQSTRLRFRGVDSARSPWRLPAAIRASTTAAAGWTVAVAASAQDAAIGGVGGWLSWQVEIHCREFATTAIPCGTRNFWVRRNGAPPGASLRRLTTNVRCRKIGAAAGRARSRGRGRRVCLHAEVLAQIDAPHAFVFDDVARRASG